MFKVGDRVVVDDIDFGILSVYKGLCGTIINKTISDNNFLVEFDELINGHDGGGMNRSGCCWYFYESYDSDTPILRSSGIILKKVRPKKKKNNYW